MERSNRQFFSIQAPGRYLGFRDVKTNRRPWEARLTPSRYRHPGLSLSLAEKEAEIVGCLEKIPLSEKPALETVSMMLAGSEAVTF